MKRQENTVPGRLSRDCVFVAVPSKTCYIVCVISLIALAVTAGCFKGHNTWQYAFIRDENGDVYYVDYILAKIKSNTLNKLTNIITQENDNENKINDNENKNFETSPEKVEAIMVAERCRVDRIEEFDVNNQEELIHEILVDMNK